MSDAGTSGRSKAVTRQSLTEAAFALFLERGFAATRLEDVALRAGVAKGTVVVHFPTKDALFTGVIAHYLEPAVARAESLREAPGAPRARLVALARSIHGELRDAHLGALPKLIVAEVGNFPELARHFHENVCRRSRAVAVMLIGQGIAAGEFRPVDPELAARLLLDPLIMHAIWRHSLGRYEGCQVDADAYLETHLGIFMRGLAAES